MLDLFLLAQYGGTGAGHHGKGHNEGCQQAERDGPCHIGKQLQHHAGGKHHGQEHADRGQGGGHDGPRHLACALHRSTRGRNAAPAQAVNIFDDNDRVIHQHANAQPQTGQAENVQGNATEIHHDNGKQHTERHADGHHQRGADIL